ncbi:MAG: TonB-dependent receptor [Tannerella sp.]|jgi:TonB-linked SusC/RagA family outer membrane protein|nr:TonB-dependent receptor [Tannerella sp.]
MIKIREICTTRADKFKFTLFMRLTLFLITLNLSVSAYGYSQSAKVSLKLKNATLKDVFREIEAQTEYIFFYYEGLIDNRKVDVTARNKPVSDVLDDVLKKKNIAYIISDRQISLVKKNREEKEAQRSPAPVVARQRITVKGLVIDESGESLPGVSITVAGGTRGVVTDLDGSFSIEVLPTDRLKFSYLGMQEQTVLISDKRELTIIMVEKADELEEVTVVAFGRQKKESISAAITTVRPSELKIPSSNLTTALAGRMAGLISYQRTGEPGEDDASFFIRGVTTLTYGAGPLILIDGVEMTSSDLARLQTDDIASFSIMKDAAATALYGARGGNGVIMVTTKEGKEGKASISFRYETSLSSPTRHIDLADPVTYMRLNNEAVLTRDPMQSTPYSIEKIESTERGVNPMVYPANDWYDILFKKQAINQRFNFNVSGGGTVARYYIAATFNQDNGVIKTANESKNDIDLKRYLLRSNVNINVTKTTEAIVRLHGTFDDYSGPLDSGSDLYSKVVRSDPVAFPAYFIPDATFQHKKHILFGNTDRGQFINPYADMVKGHKEYSKSLMMAQFELKQDLNFITEGLNLRGLFSTNRYAYFDLQRYYNPYYYTINMYDKIRDEYLLTALNPTAGSEWLRYYEGEKEISTTVYFESALNYNRTFNEKHGVSGLLVFNIRNYLKGNAGSLLLSLPKRNTGLSGRFTYGYDSRYFLEANFGYNGSERFARNHRFGFFPSAGVGWLITNEPFWETTGDNVRKTVSNLKLKATYGLVGNDAIGDENDRFFYQSEVNVDNPDRAYTWGESFGYTVNGVSISRYANSLITWEIAQKMNLGLELGLFGKIDVMADFYTESRKNILQTRSDIPSTMGLLVTPQANIGKASGKGVDLSVDLNHYFNKDFWVTGRFNYTYAKSKWEVYEEPDNSLTPWLSHVGIPVNQTWGYVAERLFVDEKDVMNSPAQSFGNYMGGDIKYKDINGDDRITSLDRVPIGYPTTPEVIYGFGLSAGYKEFDFSFFFQGLGRESFWINARKTSPFLDTDDNGSVTSKNALLKVYADDHWSEDDRNVQALWPRLTASLLENNTQTSTWFMRDGSFLRLKSLEFGYTIPTRLQKKLYVSNLRLYFSGTNLLTFSKFKLWDPEMAGDGMKYPIQRVLNAGVQLSF